jgi:hypothetical protein
LFEEDFQEEDLNPLEEIEGVEENEYDRDEEI